MPAIFSNKVCDGGVVPFDVDGAGLFRVQIVFHADVVPQRPPQCLVFFVEETDKPTKPDKNCKTFKIVERIYFLYLSPSAGPFEDPSKVRSSPISLELGSK